MCVFTGYLPLPHRATLLLLQRESRAAYAFLYCLCFVSSDWCDVSWTFEVLMTRSAKCRWILVFLATRQTVYYYFHQRLLPQLRQQSVWFLGLREPPGHFFLRIFIICPTIDPAGRWWWWKQLCLDEYVKDVSEALLLSESKAFLSWKIWYDCDYCCGISFVIA